MGELSLRVSDAEREQAVLALREHLLEGRLSLEEFSERVGLAYQARTGQELVRVEEDLPAATAQLPASKRKPMRFTAGVFSHIIRRGRLRLRKRTFAFSAFSDIDLDLREARIESPVTTVNVFALFGNIDVYVPEGVDTDVGGLTVIGHRYEWGRDAATGDAPTVRVRVFGLYGTVDIWRVPPKAEGSYREIIRGLRAQQRGELPPGQS
jgi:hypothetical protein